ncbi:MAG: hypothetical protein GY810_26180 [Aureispira sp.]|nr:hypothetical protein [Aureispira sp.]
MRTLCLLVLLLSIILNSQAQILQSTEDQALITFQILDEKNQPVAQTAVRITGERKGTTLMKKTDDKGEVKVLIPVSDLYKVMIKGCSNEADFELPDAPYQNHTIPIPYVAKATQIVEEEAPSDTKASKTEAVLLLRLKNKEGITLEETITIESKKTKKTYSLKSTADGPVEFLVPNDDTYYVHLDKAPMYYSIKVDKTPYLTMDETVVLDRQPKWELYPRIDKALLTFYFQDLDNIDVEGEIFLIKDLNTNKEYQCTTNTDGVAQMYVPINHKFVLGSKYNPKGKSIDTRLFPENHVVYKELKYSSLSEEARALRVAQMAKEAEIRDSLYLIEVAKQKAEMERAIARRDSIRSASAKISIEKRKQTLRDDAKSISSSSLFHHMQYDLEDTLTSNEFKRRGQEKKEAYKKDPLHFAKQKEILLSTMTRLSKSSKTKVVVTDITGSMRKYLVEIMLWHAMDFDAGKKTKYLFFNDGDRKKYKPLGNTGGLYFCEGKFTDFNIIMSTLSKGIAGGGGGDSPENDIEALIEAANRTNDIEELILVADNLSPVRDIILLKQVKVPVRVIVCGTERGKAINPQYLTIAYQTGGSVHTLRDDINNLQELTNGKEITIKGIKYILQNGEFIKH